jgi:GNAT superfamily N-acetyltransferase
MNTLSIDIRKATSNDAGAIADVHAQSWTGAYAGIIPHKSLTRMIERRDDKWWKNAIAKSASVLVAEIGSEVVGYATVGRNRTPQLEADGEIFELYIAPSHQGIGLGVKLFGAARQMLVDHGMTRMVVWALEENHGACDFYLARGGRDVAEGTETFDDKIVRKVAYLWR